MAGLTSIILKQKSIHLASINPTFKCTVLVPVRVSMRWHTQVRIIQRGSIYAGCNKITGIVGNNPGLGTEAHCYHP